AQKIYNSAVKLFALSKVAPVAIMVYGNAALSRIPWEVVIKEYRRNLGSRRFETLGEYSSDFIRYIASSDKLLDSNTESAWLEERTTAILVGIFKQATAECERELEEGKGKGLEARHVKDAFKRFTSRQLDAIRS